MKRKGNRVVVITGASSGFGAAAATAFAADDPTASLYGNTIVFVDAGGMESHTHYNADHTFDGTVPSMSYAYKGTWSVDDKGQLCRVFDPPVQGRTNPDCDPAMPPHAVGDNWTTPDGGKASLVQGTN